MSSEADVLDQLPDDYFTFRDYQKWDGDERYELIDGEAFAMSPAPNRRHQEVVFGLARQLADALDGGPCKVYLGPFDVRLPRGLERDGDVDTVVQPDISVICDQKKLDDAGCRGAPDVIVEVVSPATAARDRVIKRDLYQLHGVGEYWLIDPERRMLTIYRREAGSASFDKAIEARAAGKTKLERLDVLVDFERLFSD
jgi:Uma2 family endonuclease